MKLEIPKETESLPFDPICDEIEFSLKIMLSRFLKHIQSLEFEALQYQI